MEISFLDEHPDFVPQLAAWCHEEWRDFYGAQTVGDVETYFAANTVRDRIPISYVAIEDGRLCGTVTLDVEDIDLHAYKDFSPWLVCLYVAESQRGRGLGRELIEHAVNEALRLKIPSLYLWTENLASLYQRLGWLVLERTQLQGHEITIMRRDFN